MINEEYIKMRKRIRLNMIVASLLCFTPVFLLFIYGSSFLAVYLAVGNVVIAFASFAGALAVSVLILLFWLRIVWKMRAKLLSMEKDVPDVEISA